MTKRQILFAAALWKKGLDTLDIAKRLNTPESTVYRFLHLIKDEAVLVGSPACLIPSA